MKGQPTSFWGKLSRDRLEWHPLHDHCADVAAVCEALLERTLLGRRLATLGGRSSLTPGQIHRLCVYAALHDLGKHNVGFQNKAWESAAPRAGHVGEARSVLDCRVGSTTADAVIRAVGLEDLAGWAEEDAGEDLLHAAICHHGRPVPTPAIRDALWKPARGLDPLQGIEALVSKARGWFPEAGVESTDAKLPSSPAFQHGFAGLVMLADWLGSDRHFFPYSEDTGDRMGFARERAAEALRKTAICVDAVRAALGEERPAFSLVSEHGTPQGAQRILGDLAEPVAPSVTILEAETGAGKTEAALFYYARLLHAGAVDGLYFALPTRTAATQIHERVRHSIERAFGSEGPPVTLAVPGYLRTDGTDALERLPDFEVLWHDDEQERFRYRGWAAEHPKRYLAGSVVVGTIDQVLLSGLAVSHAHMRATALSRHLVVVDEVHASDAYMNRILEEVVDHHLAAGGHALLMSATLGVATQHRFLASRLERNRPPAAADAIAVPYPALTRKEGTTTARREVETALSKDVHVELEPIMEDARGMALRALDAAREGARVLVIRNTVKGCIELQTELEQQAARCGSEHLLFRCEGVSVAHHSRFARPDRERLDRAVEATLGKKRPPGGVVVCGTQTIQQSLDLDADLLITDLCPMDVLLQRVGRLHRHPRERPAGYESARAIVVTPLERDLSMLIGIKGRARGPHGVGTVYSDLRIVEATWRALEATPIIEVPGMSRALVEQTTHPELLERLVAGLGGGAWKEHADSVLGQVFGERSVARTSLLPRREPFSQTSQLRELDRSIKTRLGEEDRIVRLESPFTGPFGAAVAQLQIPGFMARDLPDEEGAAEPDPHDPRAHTIRVGPHLYRYDRLGLRREDEPTPEAEEPE